MANTTNRKSVKGNYDKSKTTGLVTDSGPYIGIIKNNVDPARLGRLQVYIPDVGGDPEDPSSWITVTYASPFFGSTKGTISTEVVFANEKQTYGFWMVPPDLDNQVLLTFVNGDISRGYWFACIPNVESKHMTPGLPGLRWDKTVTDDPELESRKLRQGEVHLPTSEINLNDPRLGQQGNLLNLERVAHLPQAKTVIEQGLETDPTRGTITSSSQREAPSGVFGFSTPGRPYPDIANVYKSSMGDPAFRQVIRDLLNDEEQTIEESPLNNPLGRVGGHTLVMDDGDVYGDNDLVRLRTAGGHTILMHDTENIIYITNKKGNAWIELTPTGAINVYGAKSYSLRSEADINLHASANVNIHAGDSINCFAQERIETETTIKRERVKDLYNIDSGNYGLLVGNQIKIKSGTTSGWHVASGELWLTGGTDIHLNTSGKTIPDPESNAPFEQFQKQDVFFDPAIQRWVIDTRTEYEFESIAPFTPTHEPWSRETGPQKLNSGTLKETKKQSDE